ncbi:hypothetical protein OROGR_018617 [Orobanche gracilis]
MTRRRTRHELIANPNKRNAAFGKRADCLIKKANQLSILCGVDVGVVVHTREGENNAVLWPSPHVFNDMLERFLNFPNVERNKKTETHERHVQRAINAEMENVSKIKNKLESRMSRLLLSEVTGGNKDLNELDLHQLSGLSLLAEEMLKRLQKRDDELNNIEQTNISSH